MLPEPPPFFAQAIHGFCDIRLQICLLCLCGRGDQVIELPIKHPELFEALGVAQPKGVLLYGPPGTGKTLLARAVAHHTDCTFIRVSGSELVQKYIGEVRSRPFGIASARTDVKLGMLHA